MTGADVSYRTILEQARQLPASERQQLAETLLHPSNREEQIILVSIQRFRRPTQARFQDLMARHNEGQLSPKELAELKSLVTRYEALMLFNAESLLRTAFSELFSKSGRLKWKRMERALRQRAQAKGISQAK